ncbi:UTP--glucose-1-phosphate uridylyltransferase GalU [Heyndrickxia acidicola]|uniref:UTP--glucose-1-phosphate uridylyltransferase n=1 Tax=Heyndrickxia acidicola TaxID=209389 RepID=A0ABU6MP61_9BACI|nr:UTP--glucose-1-phosphate uridylyltransferase GalU [Heyndrickxia acidicola]MED1205776.1 UTP--glucose-1-phosphate uridylyltransferase GalU [Heyndrickxia acidicola]
MKVRKAIIPAAGLGTRFLPVTKAMPKEMLPIVDKPAIQYIVEEAVASGIEDIIIVSGRGKRSIEDHFDKSYELEETLTKKHKLDQLKEVQAISALANIHYIRQKEPKGLGDAIYCARTFVNNEPFAVLLGDDIVQSKEPCLKQLLDVFNYYQSSVVGVQPVEDNEISSYGIIEPKTSSLEGQVIPIGKLVEKPLMDEAPSNLAIMGRYILRPEIFPILKDLPPGSGGEIQLTDAINILNQTQCVLAYWFKGHRYDIGSKMGLIQANIELSLRRPDLRKEMLQYLKERISLESMEDEI